MKSLRNPINLDFQKSILEDYFKQDLRTFVESNPVIESHALYIEYFCMEYFRCNLSSNYSLYLYYMYRDLPIWDFYKSVINLPQFPVMWLEESPYKCFRFVIDNDETDNGNFSISISPIVWHKDYLKICKSEVQGNLKLYLCLDNEAFQSYTQIYQPLSGIYPEVREIFAYFNRNYDYVISKYIEYCFKHFKGFTNSLYLSKFFSVGSFRLSEYNVDKLLESLPFSYKPHRGDMSEKDYEKFLEENGLKARHLLGNAETFKNFYDYLIQKAEDEGVKLYHDEY